MSKGNIKIPNPSGKPGFEITKKFYQIFHRSSSTIFIFSTICARNRARSHKIFFVISNPDQANENMGINVTGNFEVKTKDKTFSTTVYPFLQSDYLADQLIGKSKNACFTAMEVFWLTPDNHLI